MSIILDPIIGLPPMSNDSNSNVNMKMIDSMPIAIIRPAYPKFTTGMSTMKVDVDTGTTKYKELLNHHGYSLGSDYLKVAFLADSFPTDSFSNSYTEGFLQQFSNGLSKKASTLIQTIGGDSGLSAGKKFSEMVQQAGNAIGGPVGNLLSGVMGASASMFGNADNAVKSHTGSSNKIANQLVGDVNAIAGGSRVDFPQIWSDSQFTPSYTMTIRLFNPDPSSLDATKKYIIGPVAALLLLGIPISTDGNSSTYNYPFLHNIKSPGIYHLNPCFISNIAVIKGGDQQQIAYNQHMGIVDVRLDFGSLFSSMLASTGKNNLDRPTLINYLQAFEGTKDLLFENPVVESDEPDEPDEPDDQGVDIPDLTGDDIVDRDPNPGMTDDMYRFVIEGSGGLREAMNDGLIIPRETAKDMFTNGVITLDDLMASFTDISVDELEHLIPPNPLGFVTDIPIGRIKHMGDDMLQNIIDTANFGGTDPETIFGLSTDYMTNLLKNSEISTLTTTQLFDTNSTFLSSISDNIMGAFDFTIAGGKNLLGSMNSLGSMLDMPVDSVLNMTNNLFDGLKNTIGDFSEKNLVKVTGELLNVSGDTLSPSESVNLLTKFKNTFGDLNLYEGVDLAQKIKSIADGDLSASIDLITKIKSLSAGVEVDQNTLLSKSIEVFSSIDQTISDTGLPDSKVVNAAINLFKDNYSKYDNYDLSLQSSSELLHTTARMANDLSSDPDNDGGSIISAGLDMFDNLNSVGNSIAGENNLFRATNSILGGIEDSALYLDIDTGESLSTTQNLLSNLNSVSNDVETMQVILSSIGD